MNPEIRDRNTRPAFVSPEFIRTYPRPYNAQAADMWGLGVVLFMLMTGYYPFYARTPKDFFQRVKFRKFSYSIEKVPAPGNSYFFREKITFSF